MITSKTDIANLALAAIGSRRIASIDTDTTEEANQCRLHLEAEANGLLRRHHWNFAITRATLQRLADDPPSEWESAWQLPADCVRFIRVTGEHADRPVRDFAIEGRTLLLDGAGPVGIVYVSNAKPVSEWDSLFVDAMKWLLAAAIAHPLTQSPSIANDCMQKFKQLALPEAQLADAREVLSGENFGTRQMVRQSGLVACRYRAG